MYIHCVNIFFVKVFLFKFVSLYVVFVELSSETTTSRVMLIFLSCYLFTCQEKLFWHLDLSICLIATSLV